MHSVCQLHTFSRAAKAAGLSDDDVDALITYLAGNPSAGEEIKATGGCRKLRWPGRGKGKRGGVRTITFYTGNELPVFLITAFGKGDKTDLTQKERNALKLMTKILVNEYAKRVRKVGTK